jgi:hypothetical protein
LDAATKTASRSLLRGNKMIKNLAAILKKHKKWRLGEDE